jgi:hypothetical protein
LKKMGARTKALLVAACVGLCLLVADATAVQPAHAASFTRAFTDDAWFTAGPVQNAQWVARTTPTGAKLVLLEVDWSSVEGIPPPAGVNDPTNPAGPQYGFGSLDARVKAFAGTGISVALLVTDAPRWAEAPGGPANFESAGAWDPNPTAFGQFATALARRYSGTYPDPQNPGQALPRVKYFQAWGEANFSIHLAPQWIQSGGQWVPEGPSIYRAMLNAFYDGVKGVHGDNVVITSGFGPYGDPPGGCAGSGGVGSGCRMHPALFARELLCLHGEALAPEPCPKPAKFDAMAIDPYQVSSPTTPAFNIDDVTSPDLGKLTRVLKRASRLGRALPGGKKQLWVTEFSYDSNPPNPGGVSLATQARWLEEALYLFWKQGASTVVWYLLRDQAATYTPNAYYSGVYFYNGTTKPSFEAYRFPLVVWPNGRRSTVWGISPRTGKLTVQHLVKRSWRKLFTRRVSAGSVFTGSISARLHGNFRAVVGGESSLVWSR